MPPTITRSAELTDWSVYDHLKRRARWVGLGLIPFSIGSIWVISGLGLPTWVLYLLLASYSYLSLRLGGQLAAWPCPSCRKEFFTKTGLFGLEDIRNRDRCAHCGHIRPNWNDQAAEETSEFRSVLQSHGLPFWDADGTILIPREHIQRVFAVVREAGLPVGRVRSYEVTPERIRRHSRYELTRDPADPPGGETLERLSSAPLFITHLELLRA